MMRNTSLVWLFAVTVVACAGAGWALVSARDAGAATTAVPTSLFPDLTDPAGVKTASVTTPFYAISVARAGDRWVAQSKANYPIQAKAANDLAAAVAGLQPFVAKTRLPEWYARLGVADQAPTSTSKLVALDGADAKPLAALLVGNVSAEPTASGGSSIYVRKPGDAQSWLVHGLVPVPDTLGAWFDPVMKVAAADIAALTITDGGTSFTASKDAAGNYQLDPAIATTLETGATANDASVKRLTQLLVLLQLDDVIDKATVAATPAGRSLTFNSSKGVRLVFTQHAFDGNDWFTIDVDATSPDGQALATDIASRTANWAFRFDHNRTATLDTKIDDLEQLPSEAKQPPVPNGFTPGEMQNLPSMPGGVFVPPQQ
ncbi:MAG TPA: DUF4340 domain-containing protein [Devosiaceae bacterium]|jgi:hypothetical protein